ncbi:MAG TPA: CapA family protein [Ignavibacteriaceae bacterium]|nr:CapA family protein [Ignavibacteriaceae bacterium]
MEDSSFITIFLAGDVMTGRGIDQALPCPGDPALHQSNGRDAVEYFKLAQNANGPIRSPIGFSYIWGDAIEAIEINKPDLKIVNLETSITRSNNYVKDKAIHYRMNPGNISCLTAAGFNICTLANNHLLDFGYEGLTETLGSLKTANINFTGAGCSKHEAELPAVWNAPGKGRVIVYSFCLATSGVPLSWRAEKIKPGVNLLTELSDEVMQRISRNVKSIKQTYDIVIASIHWGSNWGYDIPDEQRRFAHALIDEAGVDIIHGHSSHHPRPMEVYKDKLIIYGTGDLINDFEGLKGRKKSGIAWRKFKNPWKLWRLNGHKKFRSDLVVIFFAAIDPSTGKLLNLRLTPMQIKKFRLNYPSRQDAQWLRKKLNRVNKKFNLKLEPEHQSFSDSTDKSLFLTRL